MNNKNMKRISIIATGVLLTLHTVAQNKSEGIKNLSLKEIAHRYSIRESPLPPSAKLHTALCDHVSANHF